MNNQSSAAVTARDLTKRFGDFTAVDAINFEVARGEIFGMLGPNGSGKTTTIRMMLGLLSPTSGTVDVLGMQVDGGTRQLRKRIGYMSQRFSLYNDLTVLQNLRFHGAAYGLSNTELEARIKEALVMARLVGQENTLTKSLSGGWRQRLALSAAILHRPDILFLDEPTAGVDPISRRSFWNMLYRFVSEGVTVFVTTHYMDEAEHCHRLAFIQRGRIIACGSPGTIKEETIRGKVLEIDPSDAVRAVTVLREAQESGRLPLDEVELYGSLVHVVAADVKQHREAIADLLRDSGVDPGQMALIEPSLEDVFIARMKV